MSYCEMSEVLKLTQQLVSYASITPNDKGCQSVLIDRLSKLGFNIKALPSGNVSNFWAQKGSSQPLLAFAGHTDVVDIGNPEKWESNPFTAEIRGDILYGRGTADMKGSLAAMLIACERFYSHNNDPKGSLGFLITSGEEGDEFLDGTPKIMEYLKEHNIKIDYCIVGEPSSHKTLGDTIRIGRRGSITGKLVIHGKQGHVAYPQHAENPIHKSLPALAEISQIEWDQGNKNFPPSSFQFTQINVANNANNIIPGEFEVFFNLRFSPESTVESIKDKIENILKINDLDYELYWTLNGMPFISAPGKLINSSQNAIRKNCMIEPHLSTGGGTSDGRFIAPYVAEIIEIGPCNSTIHQVNECVPTYELDKLSDIYFDLINSLVN